MKTLKSYSPLAIQALLLIVGYLMINAGLANEPSSESKSIPMYALEENEVETEVEDWMTDLSEWTTDNNLENDSLENITDTSSIASHLDSDSEEEQSLELWMVNLSEWNN